MSANPQASGEDDPVFLTRMTRDGWRLLQGLEYDYKAHRTIRPAVIEKSNKDGDLKLRVEHYCDGNDDRSIFSVLDKEDSELPIDIGTWADFDQQGRLVFASEGRLFSVKVAKGKVALTQLADFNDSKPDPGKVTHSEKIS